MSQTFADFSIGALRWFECDGRFIAIDRSASVLLKEMGIADADIPAVADLVDMVLLDELDSLLCCLDDWSGKPFDWLPMKNAEGEADSHSVPSGETLALHDLGNRPMLTASISSLQSESQKILLAFDSTTLNALPPFPDAWCSHVAFHRYLKPVKLHLQQLFLTDIEFTKLEVGAMVLLPDSFKSQWQAMLVATEDHSWDIAPPGRVVIDTDQNSLHLLPPAVEGTDVAEDQLNKIILTVELEGLLSMNELYTESVWQLQQNMDIALPQAIEGASVVIKAESLNNPADSSQPVECRNVLTWSGTLMKAGLGYGAVLEA